MILAAYGSTLYKLLFLGHMVTFLVAFAPTVIHPRLAHGARVHFPSVVLLGAFGLGMVFEGDWGFDQAWVSLAFLLWLAIAGMVTGLLLPAERRVAGGDDAAQPTVERAGQIVTLLVLVMLYLMIWKPGA